MKDRPGRDGYLEHLLQTYCLGAELDIVIIPASASSPLVFDRNRHAARELDQVGHALDLETMGDQPNTPNFATGGQVGIHDGMNPAMAQ